MKKMGPVTINTIWNPADSSSYPAFVPAADPADVSLASGSTSSTGSKKTFADPTGGSGTFSLAVTISQTVGTGATLQGDNSAGYYLDSLEDGDVVEVRGVFTDSTTSQKVENRFITSVAAAVYSEPSISVSGRVDGEAYNVSAGARSLTITNTDSATLATTVEKASDGSAITVTNSTATNPSWTAPGGGQAGEAVQVKVSATKNGLTSSISFTERTAALSLLTAATDPANVNLTTGTTSSTGSKKTFSSPTGGSGSATLSVSISHAAGSGGTLNGDNSAGWYVTGLEDGDVVNVIGSWTDDTTNQVVKNVFTVSVGENVPTVLTVHSVNWAQLWIDNGSSNVDLSSAGTYSLNGTDYIVAQSHSGMTATLKSTGLHLVQTAGTATDWSIALSANQATTVDDYAVMTADMSSTVSSRTATASGSSGVYGCGWGRVNTFASAPPNSVCGAGVVINGASSQNLAGVIRGISGFNKVDTQSPKVNPTTLHHRAILTETVFQAGHKATAFDATTIKPTATYTNKYDNTVAGAPANDAAPFVHIYTADCYLITWVVGGSNAEIDLLVTATTWRAWPFPLP